MFEIIKKELEEFKAFAIKGNIFDMATGIIIGASFGSIVTSLVNDIIMPTVGLLLGGADFKNLYFILKMPANAAPDTVYASLDAAKAAGAVTVNYGVFLNQVINFLIVAFAVFMLIKAIVKLQKLAQKEETKECEATTKECPRCFSTISIKATKCPNCTADI